MIETGNARFQAQLEFLLEMDKMKNIYRQTYVLHENRKENDACPSVPGAITSA